MVHPAGWPQERIILPGDKNPAPGMSWTMCAVNGSVSDTAERVAAFLGMELHVKTCDLHSETRLKQDLRVDGADAVDLLEKFAEEFEVDMSACDLSRHFGPESGDPFIWLWQFITRKKLTPITVADLVCCAETGRWSY